MAQPRPSSNSPLRRNRGEGVRALAGTAGARPGFGVVEEEDLVFFKSVLGEKGVVTDADALEVAVFLCKVDGFVPITQHVNLAIVGDVACFRRVLWELGVVTDAEPLEVSLYEQTFNFKVLWQ